MNSIIIVVITGCVCFDFRFWAFYVHRYDYLCLFWCVLMILYIFWCEWNEAFYLCTIEILSISVLMMMISIPMPISSIFGKVKYIFSHMLIFAINNRKIDVRTPHTTPTAFRIDCFPMTLTISMCAYESVCVCISLVWPFVTLSQHSLWALVMTISVNYAIAIQGLSILSSFSLKDSQLSRLLGLNWRRERDYYTNSFIFGPISATFTPEKFHARKILMLWSAKSEEILQIL